MYPLFPIYKRKIYTYIGPTLKCIVMEEFIKKVEHKNDVKEQLYRVRCNKCCLQDKWTKSFGAVSDFKKYHEAKHPNHHVYIDVK